MGYRAWVCLAAAAAALFVLSGCTLHGQGSNPSASLSGEWVLEKDLGVTAPPGLSNTVAAAKDQIIVRSRWEPPKDGHYGLTLIGVATPEIVFDATGRDMAAQVGPFVLRHASGWESGKLVTHWSTSEFMGSSFHGTWTRAVSKDGSTLTLDIDAMSAIGDVSRARLIFRRK